MAPAAMADVMKAGGAKWHQVVKQTGVKLD
jgi:hypothetical protein